MFFKLEAKFFRGAFSVNQGVEMNGHLTQAFKVLNEGLFDKVLNEGISFTINLKRKCIFGFVSTSIIEIGSDFISANKIEVLDDLLHVMVHVFNAQLKIEDHTSNQYHNKYFCEKALSVGLIVFHHQTRGWASTSSVEKFSKKFRVPSTEKNEARHECYRRISWSDQEFQLYQDSLKRILDSKPQKEYLLKYICGCEPPVIIRSGRRPDGIKPLDVTCNLCRRIFSISCETV